MKKIRPLLFVIISAMLMISTPAHAQTQNDFWSLPPNYYVNSSGSYLSLPTGPVPGQDYQGQAAMHSHNAMQDANGNLLFFVIDGYVYDKDGYLMDWMYNNTHGVIPGGQEICIVPDPGNCQRYYIFTAMHGNFSRPFYAVVDLTLPNVYTSGRSGGLVYFGTGNTVSLVSMLPSESWNKRRPGYAASQIRNDNSRFVFLHNGAGSIYRLKITVSGLTYDNYSINCSIYSGGEESQGLRSEVELLQLSNGNYRLASSSTKTITINSPNHVFYTDLDANGDTIPGTGHLHYLYNTTGNSVNKPHVYGLEFSPSGDYLYMTHKAVPNHPNPIEYIDVATNNAYPLIVTGQNDFSTSQIELGKNGKLYFATSNRLATLDNPDVPSSAWTNTAVPITYNQTFDNNGLGTTVYSYTLPDQIDGMDYTQHFTATIQCCIDNSLYDQQNFTAVTNATWTGISNPLNGGTGSVITIKESLVIPAGKTITIQNMTFRFAPGAKVIIERGTATLPGGKLILEGTTFTVNANCDPQAMWFGVQVYGDNTKNQTSYPTSKQGWFIMRKGSVVEHALAGAMAVKRNTTTTYPFNFTSYDFTYTGGVIRATDSYFKNNRVDVEFRKYLAPNNINNQSYFTNCEFTTNGLLNNPSYFPVYHVYMNEVVGIGFYGNVFQNLTPNLYTYPQLGRGIYSVNAHYFVKAQCTSFSLPCTSFNPNVFQDLFYGIYAIASNSLRTVTVDRSDFINNYRGIYLSGPDFATITRNDFEVNRSATFANHGIYLNNCSGYKVEENTFTEYNDLNFPPNGNTYGIIVNNSGTTDNEIYNNDFHDIRIGGQSQGINSVAYNPSDPYPNNVGLRWKCNTFYNSVFQADLSVTSGRIAYQQGHSISPVSDPINAVKSPAGNLFSHSLFQPQNDIAANNAVSSFEYSHHADVVTTPLYYNAAVVSPHMSFNSMYPVYFDNTNSCATKISNGGIIIDPLLKSEANNLKIRIAQKKALIDRGNTEYLLSVIVSRNPGNVTNALIAASPYLSDEVLLAYLSTNPPVGHLKQIILANSPVSDQVMKEINNRNLPRGIQNQINNSQTGKSAMSILMEEIGYFKATVNSVIDERIRLYLNDTTVVNPIDIVSAILKEEDRELGEKQLCGDFIARDIVKTNQTLLQIISHYGYDDRFCRKDEIQNFLKNRPFSCFSATTDPNLKQQVENAGYDLNNNVNCLKAEALLVLDFDTLFVSEIEPLNQMRSGRIDKFTKGNNATSGNVEVALYPNPANDMVNLEFLSVDKRVSNTYTIEVFSLTGQKINTFTASTDTVHQFSTSGLSKGIYFVKIHEGTVLIETKKLIINR